METNGNILSKLVQTCPDLSDWLFAHVARLREEFVREADEFLFGRLGQEILMWQREVLRGDFPSSEPGAGVSFTNSRIDFQINGMHISKLTEHLGSDKTMAQIMLASLAENGGRMASTDSEVVEHRAVFDRLAVEFQSGILRHDEDFQRLVSHLGGMLQEEPSQRRVLWIKMLDDVQ